jgi:hypothetical protein
LGIQIGGLDVTKAWKIAPGKDAVGWSECRKWRCIVVGWYELGNHKRFKSVAEVRKAMRATYRRGEPGTGRRAAESVFRFAHVVQPGDVVVANKGRGLIEGIGVITSDYLRPGDRDNPSTFEGLRSARNVKWRITEQLEVDKFFFVQDTVWPLAPEQCEQIRRAYLKRHPRLRAVLAELFDDLEQHVNLDAGPNGRSFAGLSDIEGLRTELLVTKATRSRRLRDAAFSSADGTCAVCRRDFKKLLDGRGQRVLQVHHTKQLSARAAPSVTKVSDLVVVCANCHLLLHLDVHKTMSVERLREFLKGAGYLEA